MSFANNKRIGLNTKVTLGMCIYQALFSLTITLLPKAMHFGRNTDRNGQTKNRVGFRRPSSKIAGLTENPARHTHVGNSITFPVNRIHFIRHVLSLIVANALTTASVVHEQTIIAQCSPPEPIPEAH